MNLGGGPSGRRRLPSRLQLAPDDKSLSNVWSQPGAISPIPGRRERPPHVWGTITVEDSEVVARVEGWRAVLATKRRLRIPLDKVVRVTHDPAPRSSVRAKLRRRAARTGLYRLGVYHSMDGWSFWSIGLGRNAVIIETSGARYRFVIIEVADPRATVALVRGAAGLLRSVPGGESVTAPSDDGADAS